ncbi:MAG: hypothetical protein VW333_05785 [Pseudomonadales bacterium]|jgi:hypothetical protein
MNNDYKVSGEYKNLVRFRIVISDNIAHITLSDLSDDRLYYDYMLHPSRDKTAFEHELCKMCEHYITHTLGVDNSEE